MLHAIAETRAGGRRMILVTGRILTELRADFPDADQWFDAVVAENGAVISGNRGRRRLAAPVDPRIRRALRRHGLHHELAHCEPAIVGHHLRNGDFSRWIGGVLRDEVLAEQFDIIERSRHPQADPEPARVELLTALENRYLG